MNAGRNALPAAMVSMPHSRISFTSRSCSVPLARSTRPLACEELAQMMSMFSACRARPNWVMPSPPTASFLLTRNTPYRFAVTLQISPCRYKIVEGTFALDKLQMHQPAGGIVDVDEQGAVWPATLEPPVF